MPIEVLPNGGVRIEANRDDIPEGRYAPAWCAIGTLYHLAVWGEIDIKQKKLAKILKFDVEQGMDGKPFVKAIRRLGLFCTGWRQLDQPLVQNLLETGICRIAANSMDGDHPDDNHYWLITTMTPEVTVVEDSQVDGRISLMSTENFLKRWHSIPEDDDLTHVRRKDRNWAVVVTATKADLRQVKAIMKLHTKSLEKV